MKKTKGKGKKATSRKKGASKRKSAKMKPSE
jgi:hypothetical protein